MGQGGLVSVALPDLVPDLSRLLRHSRHCSSGIHLCLGSDGYPLTTCGHDGWGIRFTPDASRLLSPHACRVTAADGLIRPTQLLLVHE
jgi:hypothetical protein